MPAVINDTNWQQYTQIAQVVNGEEKGRGLVPRNFARQPYGSIVGLPALAMPEFTDEEIADRLADQDKYKSSLAHRREDYKIRSLDQDGWPYCWGFSTTKALMYLRARANEPMIELSGWMLASVASGFQNRGGWCEESLKAAREVGICSLAEWPQQATSRANWTEANKAAAAKRKVQEWSDIPNDDRNTRILASLLLMNIPVMTEYNWWAHSVCAYVLLSWKPLRYKIDNSWSPAWEDDGTIIMEGNKGIPDNMACPFVIG